VCVLYCISTCAFCVACRLVGGLSLSAIVTLDCRVKHTTAVGANPRVSRSLARAGVLCLCERACSASLPQPHLPICLSISPISTSPTASLSLSRSRSLLPHFPTFFAELRACDSTQARAQAQDREGGTEGGRDGRGGARTHTHSLVCTSRPSFNKRRRGPQIESLFELRHLSRLK
jgi:hypothetical protein